MNREDIDALWQRALHESVKAGEQFTRYHFAALVAAAEREKVAAWMTQRSYATGHGDTTEDLLAELDWQIAENWTRALVKGVEGEREACAVIAETPIAGEQDDITMEAKDRVASAIRARGQ